MGSNVLFNAFQTSGIISNLCVSNYCVSSLFALPTCLLFPSYDKIKPLNLLNTSLLGRM